MRLSIVRRSLFRGAAPALALLASCSGSSSSNQGSTGAGGASGSSGSLSGSGGQSSAPILLAEAYVPQSLAVLGDEVFWTDVHFDASVRWAVVNRVPKHGGTATRASEQQGKVTFHGIAADDAGVYWVGFDGQIPTPGFVFQNPTTGLNPIVLNAEQNAPLALAAGEMGLYWVNLGPGAVVSLPKSSTVPVPLATDPQDSASCIAVAGTDVIWLSHNGIERISRVSISGGASTLVTEVIEGGPIGCVATDGAHVYYTLTGTSSGSFEPTYNHDGSVYRVPLAGGPPEVLAQAQERPHGIAVDDAFVYWHSTLDGSLNRMPKGGGAVTALVSPGPEISDSFRTQSMVLDADGVYWISQSKIWAFKL